MTGVQRRADEPRTDRYRVGASVAALLLAAAGAAHSQAPTADDLGRALREQQRAIQEEQQRERLQRREIEDRLRRPAGESLSPQPAPQAAPGGPCFTIDRVELDGASLLSAGERERLTGGVTGKCVTLAEVNVLMQAITNDYITRGYTTTRVYLPEQDLASRTLRLLILEGMVERIRVDGDGVSVGNAFPGLEGRVFNLREFEQGIDQINRLQSNRATIDIEPGDEAGNSVVVVRNEPRKPWTAGIAVDNTGTDLTGLYQIAGSFGYDNLLGVNDLLNVWVRQNLDADEDRKLSRSFSSLLSVPYGRWLASLGASTFRTVSTIQGSVSDFVSESWFTTLNARVDRIMYRDQRTKWSLGANLTSKNTESHLNGQFVAVSSPTLTVLDLTSNLTWLLPAGLVSFDAGYSRGLDALGANTDPAGLPGGAPQAQFGKIFGALGFFGSFAAGPVPLALQSTLSGQYTDDTLYGTERIAIGGPFSVRGFRRFALSGDVGWLWRNDLGVPLNLAQLFGTQALNGVLRPYVGLDVGHVQERNGVPGGTLAGATVGVSVAMRPLSIQLAYSEPIATPGRFVGHDKYLFFRVSADF